MTQETKTTGACIQSGPLAELLRLYQSGRINSVAPQGDRQLGELLERAVSERAGLLDTLQLNRDSLANWMELADDQDKRVEDDQALLAADQLLAATVRTGVAAAATPATSSHGAIFIYEDVPSAVPVPAPWPLATADWSHFLDSGEMVTFAAVVPLEVIARANGTEGLTDYVAQAFDDRAYVQSAEFRVIGALQSESFERTLSGDVVLQVTGELVSTC